MKIAIADSRLEKVWKNKEISWEDLLLRVSQTRRTSETIAEYRKMKKLRQDGIKDVGGFVGGQLKEGKRRHGHVLGRSMLSLDMDYATPGIWEQIEVLHDFQCCLYSTHKHTPEFPRLRLLIPLAREVSEDEYPALGRIVAKEIGIDLFDDTTYEATRLMYWPSTPADGEFIFREKSGVLLDPDRYLKLYHDWRDVSTWPVSSRQSEVIQHTLSKQADPLSKTGIVGAFCRAYSIEEAIDRFLAQLYEPSLINGRYDYIPADSAAGVILYDHKFAYSHHATDPACGQLLNAFDLVRLHRYLDLDDKSKEETPVSKLPSYLAMSELALQDEQVRLILAEERQALAQTEFGAEQDWQKLLQLEKTGKVKETLSNIITILRHDPQLKSIVFNSFISNIDVIGALPWKQVKPGWGDADIANAKIYFERTYGIWSPVKFKDALLGNLSDERQYHPVRQYLDNLSWDETPRLDRVLIDYMGAEDTAYVRAVTRKTMVAAVARIYQPGIKFDSVLVLSGLQGIGKSRLFAILGGKWYSDSISISDMTDKTAAEKLQGQWILELGELAGIRKTDVEIVKSFITRVDDKYRHAYGIYVESHPRQCIIVGSTNSEDGFLRDITGNRRFWPVPVIGKGIYTPYELKEVDQIWAEAKIRYQQGEELFLSGALAVAAYDQQREAMENDDREGLVADYLDRSLPEDWDKLDHYQRREFLYGGDFGQASQPGTVQRERVCCMEIWCECFGKSREALRKSDSYEIEGILTRLGGWKRFTGNKSGKLRIPHYGPQRVFQKTTPAQ